MKPKDRYKWGIIKTHITIFKDPKIIVQELLNKNNV